jgi:hypothetical protein
MLAGAHTCARAHTRASAHSNKCKCDLPGSTTVTVHEDCAFHQQVQSAVAYDSLLCAVACTRVQLLMCSCGSLTALAPNTGCSAKATSGLTLSGTVASCALATGLPDWKLSSALLFFPGAQPRAHSHASASPRAHTNCADTSTCTHRHSPTNHNRECAVLLLSTRICCRSTNTVLLELVHKRYSYVQHAVKTATH